MILNNDTSITKFCLATCGPGTTKQYIMLEGEDEITEKGFLIKQVSLETCQHFCDINR